MLAGGYAGGSFSRSQRREAIQRAHDCADHVGGHLRVEAVMLHLGMPE